MGFVRRRWLGLTTATVVVAAFAASLTSGTPDDLPGIALGSSWLLHVQRAAAATTAYLLLMVVLARSWAGDLPHELGTGGMRYSVREVKRETHAVFGATARAIDELEQRVMTVEDRLSDDGRWRIG